MDHSGVEKEVNYMNDGDEEDLIKVIRDIGYAKDLGEEVNESRSLEEVVQHV